MRRNPLTKQEKVFVVSRLACFAAPSEVVREFRETFGRDVDRRTVWTYDASNPAMRDRLSADLVRLYDDVRERYLADVRSVPIANKVVRLARLEAIYQAAPGAKVRMDALEQAAKEAGDAYTNRRELTGAGGGPIEIEQRGEIGDVERADRIVALLDAARARRDGRPPGGDGSASGEAEG